MVKVGDKVRTTHNKNRICSSAQGLQGKEGTVIKLIPTRSLATVRVRFDNGDKWDGEMNKHFFLIAQPDSSPQQNTSPTCPLCGMQGEDLVIAFYCSNSGCKNYKI